MGNAEFRLESKMSATPDQFHDPIKRRVAILWNLFFSYGSLAIVMVRNIVFVPLYLRYIDHDEYGGWLASGGILIALTQMDFGLLGVITQQVAVAFGNRDRERLGRIIGTGLVCSITLCLILFIVIGALSGIVPRSVQLSGEIATRVGWCFLIVAGANSIQLLGFLAAGVLRSLQRPLIPGMLRIVSESTALVLTWWLVTHGSGLYSIAFGLGARSLIEFFGNAAFFYWVTRRRMQIGLHAEPAIARDLLTQSGYLFLTQIARSLKLGLDPYLIGVFMGPRPALIFSLTSKAAETVRLLIFQVPGSVLPSLGHLFGEGDPERFRKVIMMMFRIQTVAAAIACAGVIAFNQPFMYLWLAHSGQADGTAPELLFGGHLLSILISVWCFGTLVAGISYDALFTMGQFLRISGLVLLEQFLRLPLMIPFLMSGLLWGAPAVSLAIQTVTLNWLQNRQLLLLGVLSRRDAWKIVGMHVQHVIVPGVAAAAVILVIPLAHTWIQLGLQGAAFCIVCGVASLLLDRELVQLLLRRGRLG